MARLATEGIYSIFQVAGAFITNPGCGACAGDGSVMARSSSWALGIQSTPTAPGKHLVS